MEHTTNCYSIASTSIDQHLTNQCVDQELRITSLALLACKSYRGYNIRECWKTPLKIVQENRTAPISQAFKTFLIVGFKGYSDSIAMKNKGQCTEDAEAHI